MLTVDAVIIGSGPAGSATAITLAQAGYRCVLIERSAFPRHRPGETLHPGIQPLIAQLGCENEFLAADFPRFAGIHIHWGSESRFEAFGADQDGPWLGFQAWRASFDEILLNRARQVGVEVLQSCLALSPVVSNQRVIGLETSTGPISAKFVIDAAGGNHWLARRLGIELHEYSPKLIARYGYCSSAPFSGKLPAIVADDSGWTWYAKVQKERFHWTRLNVQSENEEPFQVNSLQFERSANVTWRIVNQSAGLGYFVVGDAAAILDPSSSHGVLRAIMSGIMAADVICQINNNPPRERDLTKSYCQWWATWFHHDVAHLREMYRESPSQPEWVKSFTHMIGHR